MNHSSPGEELLCELGFPSIPPLPSLQYLLKNDHRTLSHCQSVPLAVSLGQRRAADPGQATFQACVSPMVSLFKVGVSFPRKWRFVLHARSGTAADCTLYVLESWDGHATGDDPPARFHGRFLL